jgi:Raf kinase inhibitor-like YbhB/YbcL family protein
MTIFIILIGFLIYPSVSQAESFDMASSAFQDNDTIPVKYTCDGGDVNPPLAFKNIPVKAKSLVLTVSDPDAPEGTWSHWVIYNIPPNTGEILENTNPGTEGLSDFGKYTYGGPCPSDQKTHHYIFHAYVLNTILSINEGPSMTEVERAIRGHIIAQTKLTGTYQKSPFKSQS